MSKLRKKYYKSLLSDEIAKGNLSDKKKQKSLLLERFDAVKFDRWYWES